MKTLKNDQLAGIFLFFIAQNRFLGSFGSLPCGNIKKSLKPLAPGILKHDNGGFKTSGLKPVR
jgi:hypothetical protein